MSLVNNEIGVSWLVGKIRQVAPPESCFWIHLLIGTVLDCPYLHGRPAFVRICQFSSPWDLLSPWIAMDWVGVGKGGLGTKHMSPKPKWFFRIGQKLGPTFLNSGHLISSGKMCPFVVLLVKKMVQIGLKCLGLVWYGLDGGRVWSWVMAEPKTISIQNCWK